MNTRTRSSSFIGEVAFGFVVSAVAAAVAVALAFVLPGATVARLVVAGLGLTIVLRSIARSDEKTGRIVTVAAWLAAAAGVWFAGAALPTYVIVHVAMVWLLRSLFSYSRLIEAGLDFGLTVLALSFALFAAVRTDSVFLAVWCFVLLQSLHVSLPGFAARLTRAREPDVPAGDPNLGFAEALRAADEALHRIAGRH